MNRRQFIKIIAAAAVAVAIPIPIKTCCPTVLTQREKELLIAEALSTPEGREVLAKAMLEPIMKSLNYHKIGEKLLMAENLEAEERYKKECVKMFNEVKRGEDNWKKLKNYVKT